jgi:hypothetical protein
LAYLAAGLSGVADRLQSSVAKHTLECGGLPPLSSKLSGQLHNDLGQACLASPD